MIINYIKYIKEILHYDKFGIDDIDHNFLLLYVHLSKNLFKICLDEEHNDLDKYTISKVNNIIYKFLKNNIKIKFIDKYQIDFKSFNILYILNDNMFTNTRLISNDLIEDEKESIFMRYDTYLSNFLTELEIHFQDYEKYYNDVDLLVNKLLDDKIFLNNYYLNNLIQYCKKDTIDYFNILKNAKNFDLI